MAFVAALRNLRRLLKELFFGLKCNKSLTNSTGG